MTAKKNSRAVLAAMMLLATGPLGAQTAALSGIKAGKDWVTLAVDRRVEYKLELYKNPTRLVVDLFGTRLSRQAMEARGAGSVVRRVRARELPGEAGPVAQVVFEVGELDGGSLSWEAEGLVVSLQASAPPEEAKDPEDGLLDALSDVPLAAQAYPISGRLEDGQGNPLTGSFLLFFEIRGALFPEPLWSSSQYVRAQGGRYAGTLLIQNALLPGILAGRYSLKTSAPPATGWKIKAGT